jgi:DNA-binding MurR/RpiR family transcriptional regulator
MSETRQPSFLGAVRAGLPGMPPTERRLAEFVLSFPGELASYNASELAKLANVSNATVSRFVQRLGYASYDEVRRHVRSEQSAGGAIYLPSTQGDDPSDLVELHFAQGARNLTDTGKTISIAEIDEIADTILAARRVAFFGFRTSQAFASYLHWQLQQVIDSSRLLPQVGQTLAEEIASFSEGDCVVFFGLPRRIRDNDLILEQLRKTGAKLLYITDDKLTPDAGATWHLRCRIAAPGQLFNHVSVMGLCHFLATRVIERAGTAARKRLSYIEAIHDSLSEF